MFREPITIVELEQPRCALRFGEGACTATGSPLCYNTWTTCRARQSYDGAGSIRWRFVQDRPGLFAFGDFSDPDNPATNVVPVPTLSVDYTKGSLNAAGVLEGKSAFGVRSEVTITMADFPWDDHVGDFYIGSRSNLPARTFWGVWTARNAFYGNMFIRVYDGYIGQSLAEMRSRVYAVDSIDGPDSSKSVTITAMDPLMLAAAAGSKCPESMDVRLTEDISASQTTIKVLTTEGPKLTKAYGNTIRYFARIGSEVLSYAAVTDLGDGTFELTGCLRGQLGTVAATGSIDAAFQRCARWEDTPTWEIGYDLMTNHTSLPSHFIDHDQWEEEGGTYLPTLRSTATITSPESVADLMGEVCQQGMFYIWWDDYGQTVPMLAVRPPKGAVARLTTGENILAGSSELRRQPDSLITRVFVYYGQRNPTASKTEPTNYSVVSGQIEADVEHPNAANGPRELSIFARFVNTEAHGVQITQRILNRYDEVPRFLTVRVDAQDRELTVGKVCDVTTRELVDSEGRMIDMRWQVISWEEVKPGEVYLLDLQTYDYVGFFAAWMADDSPDFADATDEQRADGAFWAGDDGLMPDGSHGYLWQ